jgi:hypothetical protein
VDAPDTRAKMKLLQAIVRDETATMRSFAASLGLDPAMRSRFKVEKNMQEKPEVPKVRDRNRVPANAPKPGEPIEPCGPIKFDQNGKRIYGPGEDPMERLIAEADARRREQEGEPPPIAGPA